MCGVLFYVYVYVYELSALMARGEQRKELKRKGKEYCIVVINYECILRLGFLMLKCAMFCGVMWFDMRNVVQNDKIRLELTQYDIVL